MSVCYNVNETKSVIQLAALVLLTDGSKKYLLRNHGYETPGQALDPNIALSGGVPACRLAGYTLRFQRDCSTYKFQCTSFLKFESHE